MSWDNRAGRIDHSALTHVWRQIADDIRADIESGALQPGAKLPGSIELAEIYGVAKNTTARAVAELREEGLVTVLFGRGTFVSKP